MIVCSASVPLGDIPMKKSYYRLVLVTLVLGIAFIVGCFAIATRASVSVDPRPTGALLTSSDTTRDLGQTSDREVLHVSFHIRNSGRRRLVLNALERDCACSDPMQPTILVDIGETLHVDVPLDTRFATGTVENSVSFATNDPAHSQFHLKVRAFVIGDKPVYVRPVDPKQSSVLVPQ